MTEEEKKLEEAKKAAMESVEKKASEVAKQQVDELQKSIDDKLEEITKKFEGITSKEEAEALKKEFGDEMAKLQARVKKMEQTGSDVKEKSFNDYLADAVKENEDAIKGFQKGDSAVTMTMKAVGDMSISANFPNSTPFIQEVQPGLVINPYNRVWLADLLPQATSQANSVIYPKENGGEGAVAFWDKSGNKAQVDYDFTSGSAYFKWLAGYVIVEREMLDDISWLTAYLQQKLLIGLKTAENSLILNGTSDSANNPVTGILSGATSYDGNFTDYVDMIVDAAFGQIPEKTHDFYQPTNVVLNPRDVVSIGLTKASGSGEYNLPGGSVAFGNGRLTIAGLDTVPTTSIIKKNFLTFDRNAVMFLRRMSPEIRMFEDAALAKANKVMFRVEERVSQAIFNTDAIVKGTCS